MLLLMPLPSRHQVTARRLFLQGPEEGTVINPAGFAVVSWILKVERQFEAVSCAFVLHVKHLRRTYLKRKIIRKQIFHYLHQLPSVELLKTQSAGSWAVGQCSCSYLSTGIAAFSSRCVRKSGPGDQDLLFPGENKDMYELGFARLDLHVSVFMGPVIINDACFYTSCLQFSRCWI